MYYTSYFHKFGQSRGGICIALYYPKWYNSDFYVYYPPLTPSSMLLFNWKNKLINEQQYEEEYYDLLFRRRGITVKNVLNDIPDGSTFLCYEESNLFCHRHLVAKWLNNNRIAVREL